jgi:mannose-6-phosphate isomerase-like protein (cupin superfamily)
MSPWSGSASSKATSTGTSTTRKAEFFYVVDGMLLIDLESRTVELSAQQGFVVPQGVSHRTRAPARTIILMVERSTVVPTGDNEPR